MVRKQKSKRQSCKKRYKILKKIRQHNKKEKKVGKKRIIKKDPGIPNSCPFKLEMIKTLKSEYEHEKRMEKAAYSSGTLSGIAEKANEDLKAYNDRMEELNNKLENVELLEKDTTKKFIKNLNDVIDSSNIILQVLDARDPMGTRSKKLEKEVLSRGPNKHLILVITKIDLIPKDVLLKWLTLLRSEFPTVAFKSSMNKKIKHSLNKESNVDDNRFSGCIGFDSLLKTIKSISHNSVVGVVGFPNVGKSSVINSLKKSHACNVGFLPGVTRNTQEVKLTDSITLIDSPGVILRDKCSTTSPITIISNCIMNQQLKNSAEVVERIYNCVDKMELKETLELSEFYDFDTFIRQVSKRFGKLKKGGVPDINGSCKIFLNWLSNGKIKYYVEPPISLIDSVSSTIVPSFSAGIDLNSIPKEEVEMLKSLSNNMKCLRINPSLMNDTIEEYDDVEILEPKIPSYTDRLEAVKNVRKFGNMRRNKIMLKKKLARQRLKCNKMEID